MRVTGARLVDPQRVPTLAHLGVPLPAEHDPLHAPELPGRTCERVLAIDLEDARVGDALLVHLYPVAQGGTATVLVAEEGRTRCFATLRPQVERPADLTVDIESRGKELWADEAPVGPTAAVLARLLGAHRPGARVTGGRIELDGDHALEVEVEVGRIAARFSCSIPVALIARHSVRAHPWQRVPWTGSFQWHAEDPSQLGEGSLRTFRIGAERLARYEQVEFRLDPWGGTIVVMCRGLDVVAADHLFSTLVAAVEALPVPIGSRPAASSAPEEPPTGPAPTDLAVREAAVLDADHARLHLEDQAASLPARDDPFHASEPGRACGDRTLVARVDRPRNTPDVVLTVTLDGELAGRLVVPAGTGTVRVSANVMLAYLEQRHVVAGIWFERRLLWQRKVVVGLTREVLLEELADRLPGARRRGGSILVHREYRPPVTVRLWSGPPDESVTRAALAMQDPLVRVMRRLRGERSPTQPPAGASEPAGGEPLRMEVDLPGTPVEAVSKFIQHSGCTLHPFPEGTAIFCDIGGADVSEVVGTAAAILHAVGVRFR